MTNPCDGNHRKVLLVTVLLSLFGWGIFVAFFGLSIRDSFISVRGSGSRLSAYAFPHWCYLILGGIFHTIAILNLSLNGKYFSQLIINATLGPLLISGGAIVYTDWTLYYLILPQILYIFEFATCMLSLICLSIYLIVMPYSSNRITYNIDEGEVGFSRNQNGEECKIINKPEDKEKEQEIEQDQQDYEFLPDVQETQGKSIDEEDTVQEDYETIPGAEMQKDLYEKSTEEEQYTNMDCMGDNSHSPQEIPQNEELYEYIPEN